MGLQDVKKKVYSQAYLFKFGVNSSFNTARRVITTTLISHRNNNYATVEMTVDEIVVQPGCDFYRLYHYTNKRT